MKKFFILLILLVSCNNQLKKIYKVKLLEQKELRRIILKREFYDLKKFYKTPLTKKQWKFIYEKSIEKTINPLLVLARIQVEQSLLSPSTNNLMKRMNRCCGFGTAYELRTGSTKYYGFKSQVTNCINFYDRYGDSIKIKKIKTLDIDRKIIIPENRITMMLFKYTPKYGKYTNIDGSTNIGNMEFVKVYNSLLSKLLRVRKKYFSLYRYLITLDDSSKYVIPIARKLKRYKEFAIFYLNRTNNVRKLTNMGFLVGNHSYSHTNVLYRMNKDFLLKDLDLSVPLHYFRPPYLQLSRNIVEVLRKLDRNYKIHLCDVVVYNNVGDIRKSLINIFNKKYHTTLLFHNRYIFLKNLDWILSFLKSIGTSYTKEDKDNYPSLYTLDDIYNLPQYFAIPKHGKIRITQDLNIRKKPGSTFRKVGVLYKNQVVNYSMYFDWRFVDPSLEKHKHTWVFVSNKGWICIGELNDKKVNN